MCRVDRGLSVGADGGATALTSRLSKAKALIGLRRQIAAAFVGRRAGSSC